MKKIALEEHFLTPAFVEGFAKGMRSLPPATMQDIQTRLLALFFSNHLSCFRVFCSQRVNNHNVQPLNFY
jgi:hypothetical protein